MTPAATLSGMTDSIYVYLVTSSARGGTVQSVHRDALHAIEAAIETNPTVNQWTLGDGDLEENVVWKGVVDGTTYIHVVRYKVQHPER